MATQVPSSLPIMPSAFIQIVLRAIQLYAKTQFLAVEIQHIRWHRMLAAELAVSQLPAAQMAPEQGLGIGGGVS
ncbi:hypothetical protein A9179_18715 [Pseudomonas alcaligenes]|uniref:Uncharacterized protein n=1 Tax=Aquipseudomonas alcaligenes TaxID=43263 RepID=A0ABR7S4B1_AQUAC|nr:hypothetical protein [Pseudomonas alcaligenes]